MSLTPKSPATEEHTAWPRDFDIRAVCAEQQELLPIDLSARPIALQEDCRHD